VVLITRRTISGAEEPVFGGADRLEEENWKPRKIVADLTLDKKM